MGQFYGAAGLRSGRKRAGFCSELPAVFHRVSKRSCCLWTLTQISPYHHIHLEELWDSCTLQIEEYRRKTLTDAAAAIDTSYQLICLRICNHFQRGIMKNRQEYNVSLWSEIKISNTERASIHPVSQPVSQSVSQLGLSFSDIC